MKKISKLSGRREERSNRKRGFSLLSFLSAACRLCRALPILAALAVLVVVGRPAQAQQSQMLVGNLDYTVHEDGVSHYWFYVQTHTFAEGAFDEYAQGFTTGNHAEGYRIDSVTLNLSDVFDPSLFTLKLLDGGSQPGGEQFTFRNPPLVVNNASHITFMAPPAMKLEPNTSYYLSVTAKNYNGGWTFTDDSDKGEVDAGSAEGWSIASEARYLFPGYTWGSSLNKSLIFAINGRPIPADAPPYVNGIDFTSTPAANGNYEADETIIARVSFSEAVTVTGSPVLPLTIGTATHNAAYQATESTDTELVFSYTVADGDRDDDGVSVAADALSGNIRRKDTDTDADLGHGPVDNQRPHRVDGVPLVEEPVRVTSRPEAADTDTYSSGETIEITVNLTDPATVTGDPQFWFKIGNGPSDPRNLNHNSGRLVHADYDAALSTTTSLVFTYTVQTSDVDNNGIWIGDGTETLLLDADDAVQDADDRDADLNHCVVKTMTNHKIHGGPWIIDDVRVTSSPEEGDVYRLGETIEITVDYDQDVTVVGDPEFEFHVGNPGDTPEQSRRMAAYDAALSTETETSLVFTYTVLPTDEDPNGIWIGENALQLDGNDSIRNEHRVDARPNHDRLGTLPDHKVDARPWITDVEVTSSPAIGIYYTPDETIEITVPYDQDVKVTGGPEFEFHAGNPGDTPEQSRRMAAYDDALSTETSLVFTYTVLPTDEDPNGIWIGENALQLDGNDSIRNEHRVDARPDHDRLGTLSDHRVDPRPRIVWVRVVSSPETSSDTYVSNEPIRIAVRYNQGVTVEGDPELEFSLGNTGQTQGFERRATIDADASSDSTLVFTYTVLVTDEDNNGIWIGDHTRTLKLDGNDKIANPHDSDARPEHDALNTQPDHKVDGDRNIATLSDLVLTDQHAVNVPLDPAFASATTAYGAEVGRPIDRVTVMATPTNPDAVLAWLDGDDMDLEDADAAADHQVDLETGENVVKVRVTAVDGITTLIYEVIITRRAPANLTVTGLPNATVEENTAWMSEVPMVEGTSIGEETWTKEGTDADAFTIDSSTGQLSMEAQNFEEPADADQNNMYEVTVTVTDEDDNTATVAITVEVTDVQETATFSIENLEDDSVAENEPWMSPVPSLTGTPIGAVTWTKEGADADAFTINASTGQLSMEAQNYESPEDENTDNEYEVTVKVEDADGNTATVAITVTVTDVTEAATLSITGLTDDSVAENQAWTSPEPSLTGTPIGAVTWTKEGTDADAFTIDSSTGQLSMGAQDFEEPADADTDNDYEVTVKVEDADGNTATVAITVTVTDVQETVDLSITGLADDSVAENQAWTSPEPSLTGTPIGAVTWTKEGADADAFTIDSSTGQLSMGAQDFEEPADADTDNDYEVTVKVEDADGNTATEAITVTVTDVTEAASLSITGLADATVPENQAWMSPMPSLTGTPIGAVTWTKEGADADAFTIDSSTGQLSLETQDFEEPADADQNNMYEVTVKATDADGNIATVDITVTIINVQEQSTLSITGLAYEAVPENEAWMSPVPSLTGTPIGAVTWTKEGTDADAFTIDSSTGQLSMGTQDFEEPADADTNNDYEVTVKVEDADGNTATEAITVTVTDVQETASLSITGLTDDSVGENQAWMSPEPSLTGTPIGEVTWTKEGADADAFTIDSSTGQLSMEAQNYESPEDENTDNDYEVTVKVEDADGNTATEAITVTVTDVQEAASLSITGLADATVPENQAWMSPMPSLTGTPIGAVTWTKEGADADAFTIDSSTGQLSMGTQGL